MKQLIVWLGDSWCFGSALDPILKNKQRFTQLISDQLNVPSINLSQPGSSIGHLTYKLSQVERIQKRYPNTKILLMIGLTTPWRLCVLKDSGRRGIIGVNDFDLDAYKNWAVNLFNNQHILNETAIKVSWLADQCRKNNIQFKFYNTYCNSLELMESDFFDYINTDDWVISAEWSTYSELFNLDAVDYSKIGVLERTKFGRKIIKDFFVENDRHPNDRGHYKIAQRLIPEISKLL